MPTTIKRGNTTPQTQYQVWEFDPIQGYRHLTIFKGADQTAMAALQSSYSAQNIPSRLIYNQGDTATLEVDDPTQLYMIDTWQLVGNSIAVDALSHPSIFLSYDQETISALRVNLQAGVKIDTAFTTDPTLSAYGGSDLALLKRFYSLVQRGSSEYQRSQYVLRHTSNIPNGWTHNIADVGVEMIYSTAKLLTETTDGTLWTYPLPSRLQTKIADITASPPVIPGGDAYFYGWLKQPSTETTSAHFRIDLTTEYILETWSTDYYPIY